MTKVTTENPSKMHRIVGLLVVLNIIFIVALMVVSIVYVKVGSGPAMVHISDVRKRTLEPMSNDQGADVKVNSFVNSFVPGKQMDGGVMQLEPGKSYAFIHWYASILLVLHGKFTIKHVTTDGTTFTIAVSDSVLIPAGSKMSYSSLEAGSRLYFVAQIPTISHTGDIERGIKTNPGVEVKKGLADLDLPLFVNPDNSLSYLKDLLISNVTGRELSSGLYRLEAGPSLFYEYEYEEFKYIYSGTFQLTDGTGQKIVAVGGDLMYFPKGCQVTFTSPEEGLGFYVGQRKGGTA